MSITYTIHSQPRLSSLALTLTITDPSILHATAGASIDVVGTLPGSELEISFNRRDGFHTQAARAAVRVVVPVPGRLVPQQQQRQTISLNPPPQTTYELTIPCLPLPLPSTQDTSTSSSAGDRRPANNDNRLDILLPPLGAKTLNDAHVRQARCKSCSEVAWDCAVESGGVGFADGTEHRDLRLDPMAAATTTTTTTVTSNNGYLEPGRKRPRISSSQPPSTPSSPPPSASAFQFRALPSTHWHESSEAWLCHPSGAFTAKIQKQVESGWWPTCRVGLVGERWVGLAVLVPEGGRGGEEEGCVDGGVGGGDDGKMEPSLTDWTPLYCKCGANLGTRNVRWLVDPPIGSEDMSGIQLDGGAEDSAVERREVAVTYRLEKYAVEFLGSSGGGDGADTQKAALSCTVDECLAIEMLEHAQSLGIRKFVVCDEQADEERLFLWLFNPDTDISWGSILLDTQTGASTSHDQSGKFVTVLWREITPEKPVPGRERHEVLDYPTSAITQIRAVLQGEDEGVPRDGKVVGEWRVGYLRRQ